MARRQCFPRIDDAPPPQDPIRSLLNTPADDRLELDLWSIAGKKSKGKSKVRVVTVKAGKSRRKSRR